MKGRRPSFVTFILSLLAYCAVAFTLILYGLTLWKFPSTSIQRSIINLSTNNTGAVNTGVVKLKLGYYFVCVSYPGGSNADGGNTTNATSSTQVRCSDSLDISRLSLSESTQEPSSQSTNSSTAALSSLYNGTSSSSPDNATAPSPYDATLSELVKTAQELRNADLFSINWPTASFVLLVTGAGLLIFALYFNHLSGRKRYSFLLMLGAMCTGFGLTLAAVTWISVYQAQAALRLKSAKFYGPSGELILVTPGGATWMIRDGFASAAIFAGLIALVAFNRHRQRQQYFQDQQLLPQNSPYPQVPQVQVLNVQPAQQRWGWRR